MRLEGREAPLDPNPDSPHPKPDSSDPDPDSPDPLPDSPHPEPDSPDPEPDSPDPVPDSPDPLPDSPDPKVAYSLGGLANVALAQHRPADAVSLAIRALAIREKASVPAPRLATTRFLLARALWDAPADAGRDRPRAHALAEHARDALRDAGAGSAKELAEVQAWLAEHRLP